jgi:hypothetical protein
MSWCCLQLGSREHDAVAVALHEAGMLEWCITDGLVEPAGFVRAAAFASVACCSSQRSVAGCEGQKQHSRSFAYRLVAEIAGVAVMTFDHGAQHVGRKMGRTRVGKIGGDGRFFLQLHGKATFHSGTQPGEALHSWPDRPQATGRGCRFGGHFGLPALGRARTLLGTGFAGCCGRSLFRKRHRLDISLPLISLRSRTSAPFIRRAEP